MKLNKINKMISGIKKFINKNDNFLPTILRDDREEDKLAMWIHSYKRGAIGTITKTQKEEIDLILKTNNKNDIIRYYKKK